MKLLPPFIVCKVFPVSSRACELSTSAPLQLEEDLTTLFSDLHGHSINEMRTWGGPRGIYDYKSRVIILEKNKRVLHRSEGKKREKILVLCSCLVK